ncbi:class I SAM-dependent methyltransferase [Chloroflexota bacterium]
MRFLKETSCLVCQSKDYDVVFSYDEPDPYELAVGVGGGKYFRKWMQCRSCGLYYSVYSRNKDVLENIYTSAYRHHDSIWRDASAEVTFRRVVALPEKESETKYRVRWIKDNIRNIWESGLLPAKEPPYRMLDIGGSPGVFAYEFQDDKWQSYLLDPDENAGFISEIFHIPFRQKKYEPGIFGLAFNLVCAVFLLEHLANPIDFLTDIKIDMGPDAFLYLEVPDAVCFKLKPQEDDIFNSCHLWIFTVPTLVRLLALGGFEVYSLRRIKTIRGHYSIMVLAGKGK